MNSYLNLLFEAIVLFNICIPTATLVWEVIDVDITFVFDVMSLLSVCVHLIEWGELETVQGLFRVIMRLFFFQSLAVKIEKLLGITGDKGLPAIWVTHKERADRTNASYKRGFNRWRSYWLEIRMCLPPRCVIWLYILVYLIQSANTEFRVP